MRISLTTAVVVAGLCAIVVGASMAAGTTEYQTAVKLYRGLSIVAASDPNHRTYRPDFTIEACRTLKIELSEAEKATRDSGQATYKCQVEERDIIAFHSAPTPTCPEKPADEQEPRDCPAGTVGTWLQDRAWTLQPYPDCWVQGNWTPSSPPEGMCVPAGLTTRYINVGGPAVSNYVADAHYVGGIISDNCRRTYSGIFPTRRYSPTSFEYRIPVANGSYLVRLLTRECWNDTTGHRIQRASIEGVAVPEYDTYTEDRGGVISTERTVAVIDGTLNITVTAIQGDAILNGIDVVPAGGSAPTPEPEPTGTATLRWTPPTRNTDDTALTDLAGYRIHYGAAPSELVNSVQVANPGATGYSISGLAPGVYYFGVRAYTSGGTQSAASNIVQKTIK